MRTIIRIVLALLLSCSLFVASGQCATPAPKITALKINQGELATLSKKIVLYPTISGKATQYQLSESRTFAKATWKRLASKLPFTLSSTKGNHTVYFRVRNGKLISKSIKASIRLVNGTPITTWSFSINDSELVTTSRTVFLQSSIDRTVTQFMASESPDFLGARWQPYSPTVPFELSQGEGNKRIYFKVRTSLGLESWVSNSYIELDETPKPLTITLNNGASATGSNYISLQLQATGDPKEVMVSESPDFLGAYWQPYAATVAHQLSYGTGQKIIYIKFRDNRSESPATSQSIFYDEPPTPWIFTINNMDRFTESRIVSVNILGGGEPTEYQLSEDASFATASWETYTPGGFGRTFTLSDGEGSKTLFLRFRDGTSIGPSVPMSIDYDLPLGIVSASVDDDFPESGARIRFVNFFSNVSGSPTEMRVSEDSTFANVKWLPYAASQAIKLTAGNGVKTLFAQFRDKYHGPVSTSRTVALSEVATTVISRMILPDAGSQVVSYRDQIYVTVPSLSSAIVGPGGLPLTITVMPSVDNDHFNCFTGDTIWDISLGSHHQFEQLFTIEYRYDRGAIDPNSPAIDQLTAAYYDTSDLSNPTWVLEPCTVDENREVISCKTNHLSARKSLGRAPKYQTINSPHFTVIFNTQINAPGTIPGVDGVFAYAVRTKSHLDSAWEAYAAVTSAGPIPKFKMPTEKIVVRIDDYGVEESLLYDGGIRVPNTYGTDNDLAHGLAHELFHAIQNQYMYRTTMGLRRWFTEATAELAAGIIAGPLSEMGKTIGPRFLEQSVDYTPNNKDQHQYQSSHFLNFILPSVTEFKEMFDAVTEHGSNASTVVLSDYLNKRYLSKIGPLFANFATYFLLADHGRFAANLPFAQFVTSSGSFPEKSNPLSQTFDVPDLGAKLWQVAVRSGSQRSVNVSANCLGFEVRVYVGDASDRSTGAMVAQLTKTNLNDDVVVHSGESLFIQAISLSYLGNSSSCTVVLSDQSPVIDSATPLIIDPTTDIVLTGRRFGLNPSLPGSRSGLTIEASNNFSQLPQIISWSDTEIKFRLGIVNAGVKYTAKVRYTDDFNTALESNPVEFTGSIATHLRTMKKLEVSFWGMHSLFDTYNNPTGARQYLGLSPRTLSSWRTQLWNTAPVVWSGNNFSVTFGPTAVQGSGSYSWNVSFNVQGTVDSAGSKILSLDVSESWKETTVTGCSVYNIRGRTRFTASDLSYQGHSPFDAVFVATGPDLPTQFTNREHIVESDVVCDTSPPINMHGVQEYRGTDWSTPASLSLTFHNY